MNPSPLAERLLFEVKLDLAGLNSQIGALGSPSDISEKV
jgi:hypothetical protein